MSGSSIVARVFHRIAQPASRVMPIFVAVAVITVASTLLGYWMGLRVLADNQALLRNWEVLTGVGNLLSTLSDAETAQRGFILTGDETYLQPYDAAVQHLGSHLGQLEVFTQTGDVDADAAQATARLTRQRLDELKWTIETRRQKGFEAAKAIVQTGAGQKIMDDLRWQIKGMDEQERSKVVASRVRRDNTVRHRTLVTAGAALVTLVFLLWAFRRIHQGIAGVQQQKELLAVTLASIGDGVMVTDNRGRVTFLNGEAERLTGWTMRQAWNQPLPVVFKIINEQTRQPVESPVDKVLRLGAVVGLANHTVLMAKDGRETPIDDSAAPIRDRDGRVHGVVLVFRDFTDAKRSQTALKDSEARFRSLFENSLDAMFMTIPDGTVLAANPAACAMFGMSEGELCRIGRAGVTNTTDPRHEPAIAQRASAGKLAAELTYVRKDGTIFPAEVRSVVLGDQKNQSFVVLTDITQRKAAQEALAAAKAAAEAASRAKDQFMAVLGHELRNPLNPVMATACLLREDPRFDADIREQLEVICRNAELAARLIDDLLDVTRIQRDKVELDRRPIDLCTIIRQAMTDCMPDIERKELEAGVDLGPVPQWVDADAGRLQQVFWNLLKNSIKFTPVGGCVGVRVRREEGHAKTQTPGSPEGGASPLSRVPVSFVIAEVNDSGEGMEPEALVRIFNAFEQAERSITRQFGGLGLGLTISKALVEMHGGSIQAHSDGKGKGSTFTVRLPLLPAEAVVAAETGVAATGPHSELPPAKITTRPLRILLVEDHADTALVMRRVLSAQGHKVQIAGDVATALQLADQQTFDLMLSDLGLPDGSGLDLMRALRAKGINLPGVALSGYGQEADLQASREAGFVAHLVKPVNLPKLKQEIAKVMGVA